MNRQPSGYEPDELPLLYSAVCQTDSEKMIRTTANLTGRLYVQYHYNIVVFVKSIKVAILQFCCNPATFSSYWNKQKQPLKISEVVRSGDEI